MRILIVDDEHIRHTSFMRKYRGHDLVHAYDYAQAVRELGREQPADLVQLDHDLQDFYYVEGRGLCERTGQDVARHIVNMQEWRPKHVIIHSWNPAGARAIAAILSGHVPFEIRPFGG